MSGMRAMTWLLSGSGCHARRTVKRRESGQSGGLSDLSERSGRSEPGGKMSVQVSDTFPSDRLVRIRGYGVSIFFVGKNMRNETAPI